MKPDFIGPNDIQITSLKERELKPRPQISFLKKPKVYGLGIAD